MKAIRDNQTKPNQTHTTPGSRAGGVQRGRIQVAQSVSGESEAWSERRQTVFETIDRWFGGRQHPGFAVVAYIAIQQSGQKPTKENVLARLEATGRSTSKLRENGWL